jgi:hypothetical protein
VLRRLVLLTFLLSVAACHEAAPRAAHAAPSPIAPAPPVEEPARASMCRAEPATVYGQEPVVFRIDAPRPAELPVTVLDELGRPALKSTVTVPGTFQPTSLPSGDFTLRVGPTGVSCAVTVNRELPRASQAAR